jgi:RNA polymerase sigma-70 factor (ECF subfamily)
LWWSFRCGALPCEHNRRNSLRYADPIINVKTHVRSLMNETSLSLLARIRQSADSDSWNRLVELYAPLMRGWLRSYEVTGADADDLVQDVLIVVSQELPKFKHNERPGAFRSWLKKILVNRLRNYWRARQHRPTVTGGSSMVEQLNQLEDDASALSRIWNEQHDREVVAKLIDLVRPKFQANTWDAFHRQVFGGQRPDHVAAELGMPLGSVYMARHRVLNALRREAAGLIEPR